MILLEHTAGQGSTMGSTFEEIAAMLDGVRNSRRLGVCLDTCHLLASGYDLCSEDGYARRSSAFERLIGFDRLKVFHLNDSKKPCMSRVDRHEHIGKGCIGLEPFRRLLNDPRFAHLPMIMETEKSEWREKGKVVVDPLDEMNLNVLRSLLEKTNRRSRDQENTSVRKEFLLARNWFTKNLLAARLGSGCRADGCTSRVGGGFG